MNAIDCRDLVRQYAPGRGLRGVSLTVRAGECYAVLGRNGSGKSTLVRLVAGLERPDAGRLEVLGFDVAGGSRRHLAGCGVALDAAAHWEALSGRRNAHFAARSAGLADGPTAERLQRWLSAAGLADVADEPVAGYSFGMKRKLSIIEAALHEPELLVLDEPTAGVDAQFELALREAIGRRGRAGLATLVVSSDAEWAAATATRAAFLEAGRILAEGTVAELLAAVQRLQEVRITLADAAPLPAPAGLAGLRSFAQDGAVLTAVGEDDPRFVARLVDHVVGCGGRPRAMEVRRPSLTDALLARTAREGTP